MRAKTRRGFSVVELLFTIAFSGIVICLLAMAVQSARGQSRSKKCESNLRLLARAMHNFESGNRKFPAQNLYEGKIPGPVTVKNVPGNTSAYTHVLENNTTSSYSFITQLLPQFEEGDMFESIQFDLNPFTKVNGKYACTSIPVLQCPSFTVGGK